MLSLPYTVSERIELFLSFDFINDVCVCLVVVGVRPGLHGEPTEVHTLLLCAAICLRWGHFLLCRRQSAKDKWSARLVGISQWMCSFLSLLSICMLIKVVRQSAVVAMKSGLYSRVEGHIHGTSTAMFNGVVCHTIRQISRFFFFFQAT